MGTQRITEWLVDDHRRLHALLEKARSSESFDTEAFATFRAGLLRHIAIEEKLLLPAARRARDGVAIERAWDLRMDHAALTSLLVPTPDAALVGEILSILGPHDDKEEGPAGVYAECEQLLSEGDSHALTERALALPPIPLAAHFDGQGALRTAKAALGSAQRLRRSKP